MMIWKTFHTNKKEQPESYMVVNMLHLTGKFMNFVTSYKLGKHIFTYQEIINPNKRNVITKRTFSLMKDTTSHVEVQLLLAMLSKYFMKINIYSSKGIDHIWKS